MANEVKKLNTALHNCTEEGGRLRTVIADQTAESNMRIQHLTESLLGARAEIDEKDDEIKWRDDEIDRLAMICDELDPQLH